MSLPLHPILSLVHLPKVPKKKSMSFHGCFEPYINNENIQKFIFMHNHGGRLYVTSTIGQTLYLLVKFPKGLNPSTSIASCTLPSLRPPTTREARKVRKSVAATQSATERILPAMLHKSAVLRPYLSLNTPIIGDAIACRKEKSEPRAPPSKTMS